MTEPAKDDQGGEDTKPQVPGPEVFEPVRLKYEAVYADFDLGDLDKAWAGQTVRILANPSVRFRRDFLTSGQDATTAAGNLWFRHVAAIFDAQSRDALRDILSDMDPEILRLVLLPNRVADPHVGGVFVSLDPMIFDLWDKWMAARVKARAIP